MRLRLYGCIILGNLATMKVMGSKPTAFSPDKVQNLLIYLVHRRGGMGSVELMKLVYLSDLFYYQNFGKTLTGLRYERWHKGPYTTEISAKLGELEEFEISRQVEDRSSGIPKTTHNVGERPRFKPALAPEEVAVVEVVLRKAEGLTPIQLEELTYETGPMQEVLKAEEKEGKPLHSRKIDFKAERPHLFLQRLLENNRKSKEAGKDTEYESHLRKEQEEISKVLREIN